MIFYKPETNLDNIKNLFKDFDFNNSSTYGAYIGLDDNQNNVGKCLVSVEGYRCSILSVQCDLSDKLLVEGFLRAGLNFCANRNAYMAYCDLTNIADTLAFLGFENNNGVYSGDIPTLLKGSCCK